MAHCGTAWGRLSVNGLSPGMAPSRRLGVMDLVCQYGNAAERGAFLMDAPTNTMTIGHSVAVPDDPVRGASRQFRPWGRASVRGYARAGNVPPRDDGRWRVASVADAPFTRFPNNWRRGVYPLVRLGPGESAAVHQGRNVRTLPGRPID